MPLLQSSAFQNTMWFKLKRLVLLNFYY